MFGSTTRVTRRPRSAAALSPGVPIIPDPEPHPMVALSGE